MNGRSLITVSGLALVMTLGCATRGFAQALSLDATKFGDRSTAATTIAATGVSTAAANELILAFVSADNISGSTTVTGVAGGGLTWQLVLRTNAQRGTAEVWRAFATGVLSNVTVTATLSQSVAATIVVVSFQGADATGTNGSGAIGAIKSASAGSGAPTGTVTTTRNGSLVFAVGTDWDNATARTVGAGQTMVHQFLASIGDTYWVQQTTNPIASAGTNVTINDTAPTSDRYDLSLVEVVPATSAVDTTPPMVTAVTPANGAANVATTTTVTATFSEALNAATVTTGTILLQTSSTAVPANVAYNASTHVVTLTPNTTLSSNTLYTATIVGGTGGVTDVAGNALASSVVWTFTTAPADTMPPAVVAVTPTNGATNVSTMTTVTAAFSEAVNASSINASTVFLTGPGNTAVPATLAYNAATFTATLTPNAALTVGTVYTATVKGGAGGVTDVAGNAMASTIVWTFTTVTSVSLTIDTVAFGDRSTPATTAATSAFSTTSAGEVLLAFVGGDASNSGTNVSVTGISGGGLAWQLAVRTNVQRGTAEVWRAFAPTALTNVTVTATLSQSVASSIVVVSFQGADTSGTSGSGAIGAVLSANAGNGAPTGTLTTIRNGSLVFGIGSDYDNASARTLGNGQTMVHQFLASVGDTYWVQRSTNPIASAGTPFTINDTAPVSDRYNLSVVEVLAAAATSDTTPPTIAAVAPANGATNVSPTTVTATFSEAMNPSTVNTSTVLLAGPGNTAVPATVTYDSGSLTATLTPSSALTGGTTYTATVKGGSGGVTDVAGNAMASTVVWTFTTAVNNFATVGQWSPVISWPLVAINATLLKTGEVLLWDGGQSVGSNPVHGGLSARLWNPTTQAFTSVPESATDLFCSGMCALSDGRIFVAGGGDPSNDNNGVPDANIFDPSTRSWSSAPKMAERRWYPTATCLPDGRVLMTSGSQFNDTDWVTVPEVYNPSTNSWTRLTGAQASIPFYTHVFVLPDGRVLDASSFEQAMSSDTLDLTTLQRVPVSSQVFDGGSAAMYLPGKIIKTGTAAENNGSTGPAATTSYVLDMTQPVPSWRKTTSMNFPRSYHTLTLLPDGTVIATGGGKTESSTDVSNAVFNAEIWSPVTELWTTMSAMQTPRLYHSTGLLLPDARVLVAGGGRNFNDSAAYTNAEIFSPPYLFKGARPTITSAPTSVSYGGSLNILTPDAANITSVVLIRNGAVTHGINMEQRLVPLAFQQSPGGLTITAPANANLAPPGYYMLFIVNASGVPSVASMIRVGP